MHWGPSWLLLVLQLVLGFLWLPVWLESLAWPRPVPALEQQALVQQRVLVRPVGQQVLVLVQQRVLVLVQQVVPVWQACHRRREPEATGQSSPRERFFSCVFFLSQMVQRGFYHSA